MRHADILSYEEIAAVARQAAETGIQRIRLTGGEPLVRPDLHRLIALLKDIPGIGTVVMTTNAVLLKAQLPQLLAAGLDGVNISLNAMDRDTYRAFTGRDEFEHAMEGLRAAIDCPDLRVKINCVPTEGREEQLLKLAALARDTRAAVRFIELMPIGAGMKVNGLAKDALLRLLTRAYGEAQKQDDDDAVKGPAVYFRFPGFRSDIGFISAVSRCFCESCNRIRLTADGKLKSCLAFPAGEDVRGILRNGGDPEEIRKAIIHCIQNKPAHHHFGSGGTEEDRMMSQIGG